MGGEVVMKWKRSGAWLGILLVAEWALGAPQGSGPRYDPKTEVTLRGTVEAVTEHAGQGYGTGVHVTLRAKTGTVEVHLGPATFLRESGLELARDDSIEIVGSRVKGDQGEYVIARQVRKGDKTVTLRDSNGVPAWSGRGGRRVTP
jgi:hypothetical protein